MRRALHSITKHAMTRSAQEPRWLLYQENVESQVRPDLEVSFPINMLNKVHAVDIGMCCPYNGSFSGSLSVEQGHTIANNGTIPVDLHLKRACDRVKKKNNIYKELCDNRHFTFVPFIIYTTGMIHNDGVSFLKSLAKHASEARNVPVNTLLKYYFKILNFTMIKEAARIIYAKSLESVTVGRYSNVRTRSAIREGNVLAHEIANPQLFVGPAFRNL